MQLKLEPIGFVINSRKEIEDDNWSEVISEIELGESIISEALEGIEEFSHLEIIFYMNQVIDANAIAQYRHPRKNQNLPRVGTFAQRNKNRPNKLGLTTVNLIARNGKKIVVRNLDAINGTPILGIKPVMKEFEPKGAIRQPKWTHEIMENYW